MDYLAHFEGAYLEDSYLMGIIAERQSLRLKMLLALTSEHSAYAPPATGEARCFRDGSIFIERPKIVEWRSGKPMLSKDADDTFDFGNVELYRHGPTVFRLVTGWFDTTVETSRVSLVVD